MDYNALSTLMIISGRRVRGGKRKMGERKRQRGERKGEKGGKRKKRDRDTEYNQNYASPHSG